jgi:hypothetical protein
MVQKSKKQPKAGKKSASSDQTKQLKLDFFPSNLRQNAPTESKQIIINKIDSSTKYDDLSLTVEFKLIPSKTEFSKVRSTLWFDDQEVKSALIQIPQGPLTLNEFELKTELDMRGISPGAHTVKVEINDLFSTCYGSKKETITYTPVDRKASYRKIPLAKKTQGSDFAIIQKSHKQIYQKIEKTIKNELESKQDKW